VNITKRIVTQRSRIATAILLANLTVPNMAIANDESLWDMSLEELGQIRVTSLATGTATPLDKAAAVATVITEEDIIAMGATDIDQVLETVPGLHVGRSEQAYAPKYNIRGITSSFNAQTLMLINGVPVTNLVFGNRGNVWAGMPVKSISRIEVIRGPGSAMYGADAFAGVINIITKSRKDINGTIAGYRQGSFDTQAGWLEHGQSINGLDIGITLEYETTDGQKEIVEADVFGNSGPVNRSTDMIDARIDLAHENSRLRIGYQDRSNIGTGTGILQLLDNQGRFASERFHTDYTHTLKDLSSDLSAEGRISYYRGTQEVERDILLAGPGQFGPAFPQGFIGNPGFKEENARFDLNATYKGLNNHIIRFGAGAFWGDIFETTETKNFDTIINPDDTVSFPPKNLTGDTVDVSDTAEVWLPETDRTSYHLFAQDEWQLAENWQLTSGVRFDHYSDFGDTTNPRFALIWATTDSITTKFLYGRAFRAPSISELFVTSNPVSLGSPNNEPETIDTYELAFSHQLSSKLHYSTNVYYYEIEDLITLVNTSGDINRWLNTSSRTGYGMEFEMDYKPDDTIRILTNYSYQKSEDDASNDDVGDAPNHQFYVRAEWKTNDNWLIVPQLNWVGKQVRTPGDTLRTDSVSHYTTIDLTIKQHNVAQDLDIAISVHNFFDRKYVEPSPISSLGGIAADLPMPGRSIYGEVSYRF
jgi:iron complex outermembrane receptor protein